MQTLQSALSIVHARIKKAAQLANRPPESIALIAVSKTFSATAIAHAYHLGQRAFGENYVQEAITKISTLSHLRNQLIWHFIGPLQSNKTQLIATHFDWVHSLDRFKIAQRLSQQRPPHLPPLQVCLQVNISDEISKHGINSNEVTALALQVNQLKNINLRGLMAIPAPTQQPDHKPFIKLRKLLETCNQTLIQQHFPIMDTLSMGMSADLEIAIIEGATMLRIGNAIFGVRK